MSMMVLLSSSVPRNTSSRILGGSNRVNYGIAGSLEIALICREQCIGYYEQADY